MRLLKFPMMTASTIPGSGPVSLGVSSPTAFPRGISGSLDGQKEPKNKLESILNLLGPYRERSQAVLKSVRSWGSFFAIGKLPESADVAGKRAARNLSYFQANYTVLVFILLIFFLLRSPLSLLALGLLGAGWMWFFSKNDDITWKPVVWGTELNKTQRLWAMAGLSAVVFLMFALDIIFTVAGVGGLVVGIHAILNPGAGEEAAGITAGEGLDQI